MISSTEVVFLMPCSFTNEDFLNFVHPDSHISHLLAMHGFLVDYLLGQFCVAPGDSPKFTGRRSMIMIWARNLANSLPPGYRKFMKWALEFCENMETLDGRYLLSP
ncbi:hypothetical protein ESCO_005784 [Escovopsis weberi]|uniref:Uncharacterized protein n=1 Tax=Escovopsis weberi TaxID=150374 RepID=A0A0M9VUE3_ESCWE|nr:hypothetical protein ESCO_005784 [Escovopsis weberi]